MHDSGFYLLKCVRMLMQLVDQFPVLFNRSASNVWQTHYFLDVRHPVVFYKLMILRFIIYLRV